MASYLDLIPLKEIGLMMYQDSDKERLILSKDSQSSVYLRIPDL